MCLVTWRKTRARAHVCVCAGTLRLDPTAPFQGKFRREYASLNNKCMELRKVRGFEVMGGWVSGVRAHGCALGWCSGCAIESACVCD